MCLVRAAAFKQKFSVHIDQYSHGNLIGSICKMTKNINCNVSLLAEFKFLLKKGKFSTQRQLAKALEESGFNYISQPKVSRLIKKAGAIKVRGNCKSSFYQIPENQNLYIDKSISSLVIEIDHNNIQVVIKTV